ncbi:MAG: thiamine phosphate synthase, partial [Planctomycetales bacterium]|nr:thiamine phosphate synthase [Planctomycetales bacterium]
AVEPAPRGAATSPVVAVEHDSPSSSAALLRIVDAAANRAGEGLRVVEDVVRFALDDAHLTNVCKQIRHELASALAPLPLADRLRARETTCDVGIAVDSPDEYARRDLAQVLAANFVRVEQALRSLEEVLKVALPGAVRAVEQLRYRTYTLQRVAEITRAASTKLVEAAVYVLLDGRDSQGQFREMAQAIVAAGAAVVQLRDKRLSDAELLARGRVLRDVTRGTPTLFIMNDRPDLAVLADADGVHVGQDELSVHDVRKIIGPERLVGVSTHNIEQARAAVLAGADYLGVGPTFASTTKTFETLAGLEFVRAVAAEIRLPAFAIGGITPDNVGQVVAAGLRRVAVGAAVIESPVPAAVIQELTSRLRP